MDRPGRDEAAEYYFTYIDQAADGDIGDTLEAQGRETLALLRGVSVEDSLRNYAPDKWTLREVVGHLCDTERLFVFRAMWFARGFETALPSFDQTVAQAASGAAERTWPDLLHEFAAVRAATVAFVRALPPEAWDRRGVASGNPFTVRALAYLAAGHVAHHTRLVRERYLGRGTGF